MAKWILRDLELECVGLEYRMSKSTRRFLKARAESKPIQVEFKREPSNVKDENAIAVFGGGQKDDDPYYKMKLGYVPRKTAAVLAEALDSGRAEFGISLLTAVDEDLKTADLQVKLRVRRNFANSLDKM